MVKMFLCLLGLTLTNVFCQDSSTTEIDSAISFVPEKHESVSSLLWGMQVVSIPLAIAFLKNSTSKPIIVYSLYTVPYATRLALSEKKHKRPRDSRFAFLGAILGSAVGSFGSYMIVHHWHKINNAVKKNPENVVILYPLAIGGVILLPPIGCDLGTRLAPRK